MSDIANIKRMLAAEPLQRSFTIERDADVDDETRTVTLAFASNKPIEHWFGKLELSLDKKHIRSERLDRGIAVLCDHNVTDHVGVTEGYSVDAKTGVIRTTARFGSGQRATEIFNDIKDGIRKEISVGFRIYDLQLVESTDDEGDLYRSEDWEPYEISVVAVPADISVGIGRALEIKTVPSAERDAGEKNNMANESNAAIETATETNRTAETAAAAARQAELVEFAELFGEGDIARSLLLKSDDVTRDDIRAAIKAKQSKAAAAETPAPVLDAQVAAERQGVQLARSATRALAVRSFTGEGAAERAYRFGKWLLGGPLGRSNHRKWCQDNGIMLQRGQVEGDNESGGYLVPEEFGQDMIDLRERYGVLRQNARIVPMASDKRSDPMRLGGISAEFVDEATAPTHQTAKWTRINLDAKKVMVLTRYSSEVGEDAVVSMGDDLAYELNWAFALKEDECGFISDGTSPYGGIVGITENLKGLDGTVTNIAGLQVGSGNAYSELVLTDFEGVVARLPERFEANAKWYVSKAFYWNVMVKLALAASGSSAVDIEADRGRRYLGYPVVFTSVMPKAEANSQVCALLGDLMQGVRFGDRRDLTIAVSEHALFDSDQTALRATQRFDINSTYGVGNASATASARQAGPIVGLITAGS